MRSAILALCALLALCGCAAERPTVSDTDKLAPSGQRVGHVFLVRGLTGMFSRGMDQMRDQLRNEGVASTALMHTAGGSAAREIIQSPEMRNAPLVIIGHSLGADEAVSICRELSESNVSVDLLVTIDPVNAPRVPANVRRAVNYYRSNGMFDLLPLFRGTPLHRDNARVQLVNVDLNRHGEFDESFTNHFTIDKNRKVQRDIVKQVLAICPSSGESKALSAGAKMRSGPRQLTEPSVKAPGSEVRQAMDGRGGG